MLCSRQNVGAYRFETVLADGFSICSDNNSIQGLDVAGVLWLDTVIARCIANDWNRSQGSVKSAGGGIRTHESSDHGLTSLVKSTCAVTSFAD